MNTVCKNWAAYWVWICFWDTMGLESVIHDVSEALAFSPLGSVLELPAPLLKKLPRQMTLKHLNQAEWKQSERPHDREYIIPCYTWLEKNLEWDGIWDMICVLTWKVCHPWNKHFKENIRKIFWGSLLLPVWNKIVNFYVLL